VGENVADAALKSGSAGHRSVEPRVTKLVIDAPLRLVGQYLIGLVHLFELRLGRGIARVAVGVMLQSLAPIRLA
jgi:hypothetical protein